MHPILTEPTSEIAVLLNCREAVIEAGRRQLGPDGLEIVRLIREQRAAVLEPEPRYETSTTGTGYAYATEYR